MRKLVVLWVVSVAAAAGVSAVMTAQAVRPIQPQVLSEVGFRAEGQRTERRTNPETGATGRVDILTGHLVVKVNGEWVEAELSGGRVRPLTN